MKKSILLLTAAVAMVLFGCKENPYINAPGENSKNLDSIPEMAYPDPTPDPEGVVLPEGCINVYEARRICRDLYAGQVTKEKYYVKGWVTEIHADHQDAVYEYGNGTFFISATNDGKTNKYSIEAYQVYGKDGKKLLIPEQVQIGDFVIIYGTLTNYDNRVYETEGKGSAHIYYSTNEQFDLQPDPTNVSPDPEGVEIPEGCLNVYEAIHICDSIGSGKATADEYYVKGWIFRLGSKTTDEDIKQYGNATFFITATNDGTANGFRFEAYQVKGKNKARLTGIDQVRIGDFVILRCKLKNYSGTPETDNGGYIYYSTNENIK